MTRGTTPVIILTLPRAIEFDTLYITVKQGDNLIFEKTLDDVELKDEKILMPLSQADTLALSDLPGGYASLQLRGKVGANAYASKIKRVSVSGILKEGEI